MYILAKPKARRPYPEPDYQEGTPQSQQPPASTPPPKPEMFNAMVELYNSVREGRVTDIKVILDLADRFDAIASNPDVSQMFPYDPERAASSLRERARALKEAEMHRAVEAEETTELKRATRRTFNDNLAAGG
jgi:hypothetical protein